MLNIALINCGSDHNADINSVLFELGCKVRVIPLEEANGFDFVSAQAAIVSGGPQLFTSPDISSQFIEQFSFLDMLKLPLLGICLGHQALGIRAGVKAYLGEERRTEESIRIVADHPLFKDLPPEFIMKEDHCEGIPLPEGFRNLASSEFYPVEVMASNKHPHYGVQFHPEISGEYGKILISNFCQIAKGV